MTPPPLFCLIAVIVHVDLAVFLNINSADEHHVFDPIELIVEGFFDHLILQPVINHDSSSGLGLKDFGTG